MHSLHCMPYNIKIDPIQERLHRYLVLQLRNKKQTCNYEWTLTESGAGVVNQEKCNKVRRKSAHPLLYLRRARTGRANYCYHQCMSAIHYCLFYSPSAGGPRLVCFPAHGTHTTQRARNLNKQNADPHFIASFVN